ncbi:hypothetical protein PS943_00770 [Pseudomonas fluorescens]|uniref:Uncharacterized protein n=1 Tax=Pseudomonas fluorescens TaxID=294 RepID=A0A5E7VZX9_PSEFL|nr:hypothetical protein PS943_00770 [Pseudomonas fluorescens]
MTHWNELEQSIFFKKVFSSLISIGKIDLFSLQIGFRCCAELKVPLRFFNFDI